MNKTSTGEITACDPCLYEQVVQPWELLNTPDERGSFIYKMRYLTTSAVTVYQERFDLRTRLRGQSPPGFLALSVPIRLGPRSSYWKAPLHQTGFPVMLPGSLDVTVDTGQVHLIVLINLSLLREHLPVELTARLERAALEHLLPAKTSVVDRFGATLLALINKMYQNPEMPQQPAVARAIEEDLLCRLTGLLNEPLSDSPRPKFTKRKQALQRALEYLNEADPFSLTMLQLSKKACVSQRTLEYAFREAFDLTPIAFMRLQRFHAARRMLMAASSKQTTVTRICLDVGLYHLGRFSTDYQQLFGESPTSTLQRQYENAGSGSYFLM